MSFSTITISNRIKRRLMKLKGKKSWDEFFEKIIREIIDEKLVEDAWKFQEEFKLSEEDAERMLDLLRRRRKDWRFRYP